MQRRKQRIYARMQLIQRQNRLEIGRQFFGQIINLPGQRSRLCLQGLLFRGAQR